MISALSKPFQSFVRPKLLSGAMVVAAMTMAVKGVAFLKELVVAHRFGTSDDVDAFVVAMLIPSVVALAVGNAFRDALLPVYAQLKLRSGPESARLISNTLWCCGGVLLLVSLLALVLDKPLMALLAKGFSPEKQAFCAALFRWVTVYTICVGIASVLKGYLQAHERFALSALAPVMIPGCTIAVLLTMPGEPKGSWLAMGTAIGAGALLAILFFSSRGVHHGRLLERPAWDEATRSVLRNTAPLLAGAVVIESYLFVDTMMVATLPAGSVAILTYGERICGVLTLVGIAVVQALFPHISELVAREAWKPLVRMFLGFSSLIIVLSIPVVMIFWFAPEPIVRFVFERGEFTARDTAQVADVLRFAGLQVPGAILLALGARAVMALRANRFVLVAAICGLVANVALNILFIRWFGVKGVALSTALVNVFSASMLFIYAGLRLRRLTAGSEG